MIYTCCHAHWITGVCRQYVLPIKGKRLLKLYSSSLTIALVLHHSRKRARARAQSLFHTLLTKDYMTVSTLHIDAFFCPFRPMPAPRRRAVTWHVVRRTHCPGMTVIISTFFVTPEAYLKRHRQNINAARQRSRTSKTSSPPVSQLVGSHFLIFNKVYLRQFQQ